MSSAERIGVLGGTFDPVHVGHLVAALGARHELDLDRVLLVVANEPWQKVARGVEVTPAEDRLAMVEAALSEVDGLEASRLEIERGGPSFTADTLAQIAEASPRSELFLVVGDDVVGELTTWERVDEIRRLATLAVISRAGHPPAETGPGWRVRRVDIPLLAIASSDLRHRAARGAPLDFLVPPGAIRFIRERALYAVPE
jgi:nicotinate-nucleotide adenylyltransferase